MATPKYCHRLPISIATLTLASLCLIGGFVLALLDKNSYYIFIIVGLLLVGISLSFIAGRYADILDLLKLAFKEKT